MAESLLVHEIYLSIQGESTFAGLPCAFVRLTGCDLRCSYCDTAYAFKGGKAMALDDIVLELENRCDFTGEPGAKSARRRSVSSVKALNLRKPDAFAVE